MRNETAYAAHLSIWADNLFRVRIKSDDSSRCVPAQLSDIPLGLCRNGCHCITNGWFAR